jgi:hypothetical protein
MSKRGYTILGWAVWQITTRAAKVKVAQNRTKLGAAATVLLVLVAGVVVAKLTGGEDEA